MPNGLHDDEVFELLELFGDKVIPAFDKDPVHSTTRYRESAKPKYPMFDDPVPDLEVKVLPASARKPLPA